MTPIQFYKCLADDTRLKSLLLISQTGEACVCDLKDALKLDQPKTSRHLAELRKCGILQDERRGKWVYYKLQDDLPDWAKRVIHETAKQNPDYYQQALETLKACQVASNRCC
ncbi:metalloregulator ArsR/SmtB family transcription factor [Marinomonas posidonica]|uniref:Transcriptional regulator, ArsR family n=1 Tax=Marinomonas posidonica (strain CECT 7376 / NCIMB 14433 / IVIA-Po-181) TaxID=491952 RepID=F6CYD3_MARPP|nr:metalloregulator ArsR/SmtB family transcription factor [Marinomonas posidonica]AEF53460.1 transcriptional regulator, ArsR family [Marinomonas posidonica IVIA-Po-181]